eukprot:scaffold4525_cov132-Amphora_coffeaeformis.AAC.8
MPTAHLALRSEDSSLNTKITVHRGSLTRIETRREYEIRYAYKDPSSDQLILKDFISRQTRAIASAALCRRDTTGSSRLGRVPKFLIRDLFQTLLHFLGGGLGTFRVLRLCLYIPHDHALGALSDKISHKNLLCWYFRHGHGSGSSGLVGKCHGVPAAPERTKGCTGSSCPTRTNDIALRTSSSAAAAAAAATTTTTFSHGDSY